MATDLTLHCTLYPSDRLIISGNPRGLCFETSKEGAFGVGVFLSAADEARLLAMLQERAAKPLCSCGPNRRPYKEDSGPLGRTGCLNCNRWDD